MNVALIDSIRALCGRLAPRGWGSLLNRHGLDITATNLAAELERPLAAIQRESVPGFADFHPDGVQGITPGVPAMSLLFHAFASPGVHPTVNGLPSTDPADYPTLEELDSLENYIYSRAQKRLTDFPGAVIAVFAYQYRTGQRAPHGLYADFAFSRTGIARVGTAPAHYDAARGSFWVVPENGSEEISVLPARYAAFLAMPRKRGPADALLGGPTGVIDANRTFLIPVHKLFSGAECLQGSTLTVSFAEFHRNEKPHRVHKNGGIPALAGFDVSKPPFLRDSVNAAGTLVTLQKVGAGSELVVPVPSPRLVRTATQHRATTGKDELVRFKVPAKAGQNRFWTSFDIVPQGAGRAAPEYLNIRHRVVTHNDGSQTIDDLNVLPQNQFTNLLNAGGYEAAHFIDDTCDGCVSATVTGVPDAIGSAANVHPAYSLVTAPDFFPLMDQLTIFDWASALPGGTQSQFAQSSPEPLARGRTPSNPTITRPGSSQPAFDRSDVTMTAVIGHIVSGPHLSQMHPAPFVEDHSVSFLSDAGSNVFEPGWDVSLGQDAMGTFHTAFGLGSPFPEDAKLCAALNSFWPAAAPDATRTFGLEGSPTAQPLLDGELGFHPQHPRVKAGEVAASLGWDGEQGPFLETVGGQSFVNYASKDRSDYVSNALAGQVRLAPLLRVDAEEMIRRMEALRACIRTHNLTTNPPSNDVVSTTSLLLARAEQVTDWAARPDRGDPRLLGPGYLYVFVLTTGNEQLVNGDLRRVRMPVTDTFLCQIAMNGRQVAGIVSRSDGDPFVFHPNP